MLGNNSTDPSNSTYKKVDLSLASYETVDEQQVNMLESASNTAYVEKPNRLKADMLNSISDVNVDVSHFVKFNRARMYANLKIVSKHKSR